jgi:hypothetical protein
MNLITTSNLFALKLYLETKDNSFWRLGCHIDTDVSEQIAISIFRAKE